jgi:2-polyprenyl-3-methyl-5-hydroxy-6-metoxy-1,4-benzoquinol methylase
MAILRSNRFSEATVVDLSPRMLEMARERMKPELKQSENCKTEFVVSDVFALEVEPPLRQYDLVLCLGLIAHTGRFDELLAKLKGLVSPTGSILLQSSLQDHPGNKIVRALTETRYYKRHGYRVSYFRHEDIVRSVTKAGLAVSAARRFTFGFPFGDRLCARLNYGVERAMRKWSSSHGAEALYLLRRS